MSATQSPFPAAPPRSHLCLLLAGIGPGDEVLVPSFTFVATASAVVYLGGSPVFVDSSPSTWNIDPDLVEAELSRRAARGRLPAAMVSVDLYGQSADYDRLVPLCSEYGIPLIEDAAEALGATYQERPTGSFGTAAVFSFNGNKIITTSGGGMLVTDSAEMAERARFLATQARDPFPHYEHSALGYNYRLSNLLAALGRGQLRGLDQPDRATAGHPRALSKGARRRGRESSSCRSPATGNPIGGSPASWWTPTRSAPIASRSGSHSRRSTSSRDRPGSRCISSRCSQACPPSEARCVRASSNTACVSRPAPALTEAEIDRVVETVLAVPG